MTHSCVPISDCIRETGPRNTAIRSGSEDAEIADCSPNPRSDITPASDGAGILGPRGAEDEEEVCCHQDKIIDSRGPKPCSDYAGHR